MKYDAFKQFVCFKPSNLKCYDSPSFVHSACGAGWLPLEYVPVKAKLRSFVPLNGAICIHAEMRLNLHDWGWYWALCCGSSAGMWDVNSPAPDCQYPELFNQTPAASPALSLVSVHRPQTQNNFQTRQIKGKMERECHSLTLARWQHSMQAGNSSIN